MIVVPDSTMIETGTVYYEDYSWAELDWNETYYRPAFAFFYGNNVAIEYSGVNFYEKNEYFDAIKEVLSEIEAIGDGDIIAALIFEINPETGQKKIVANIPMCA